MFKHMILRAALHPPLRLLMACLVFLVHAATTRSEPSEDAIRFNRDIRPLLSDNCFACHGPDKNARKAGLRLDQEEDAKAPRDHGRPLNVDSPPDSLALMRILSEDPDLVMPPPSTGKRLTNKQKDTLKEWILQGSQYEGHWSYIPPERPPIPEPLFVDAAANPIDAFIQARMKAKKLSPAPVADKEKLLRRVCLDLTGLPPTPERLKAFIHSTDPDAFAKAVEDLLESKHYGERMASPWLDWVRFADTVGYHGDQVQNVFPYRDYVVNSFNSNKPFDLFTLEQIAGDLLTNPTVDALVATCFNRLNMMTREGGAQAKEYLAKYQADRVRTVSTLWLGSTMACAECHDHKFDPFTTKDFYSMSAFFADIKQWGVYGNYGYLGGIPEFDGFDNESPFPPELEVENDYLKNRKEHLIAELNAVYQEVAAAESTPSHMESWEESIRKFLNLRPDGWSVPSIVEVQSNKETQSRIQEDGSLWFGGKPQGGEKHEIHLQPIPGTLTTLRLEVIPDPRHRNRITRGDRDRFRIRLSAQLKKADSEQTVQIPFRHADAELKAVDHWRALPRLDILDGWESRPEDVKERHTAYYRLNEPIEVQSGDVLQVSVSSDEVGRIRLAATPIGMEHDEINLQAEKLALILNQKTEDRETSIQRFLTAKWIQSAARNRSAFEKYKELDQAILECRDGRAMVMVTESRDKPLVTRILPRGNWQDETGEIVEPAVPEFLGPWETNENRTGNRLDLARWLVSRQNPLTARVFVNRLWKQFFGTGLSNVIEDLGSQGEWPTHPQLLDWLAVEFMDSGWDVKHMVRLIATSHTYRQSSQVDQSRFELDPANRYYSRQSPRRLEAEFIRDHALFVSGLLNPTLGGPSSHPYQPAGYYVNLNFPRREYEADKDQRQYRRGLYTHWQRTFLHPMLANFDASSREECVASRTVSNTPQQALNLLNDPSFVEAAYAFADDLLKCHPEAGFDTILDAAMIRVVCRKPSVSETQSLRRLFEAQRSHFEENPEQRVALSKNGIHQAEAASDEALTRLAAWTSVCRVLLNLHESITLY